MWGEPKFWATAVFQFWGERGDPEPDILSGFESEVQRLGAVGEWVSEWVGPVYRNTLPERSGLGLGGWRSLGKLWEKQLWSSLLESDITLGKQLHAFRRQISLLMKMSHMERLTRISAVQFQVRWMRMRASNAWLWMRHRQCILVPQSSVPKPKNGDNLKSDLYALNYKHFVAYGSQIWYVIHSIHLC